MKIMMSDGRGKDVLARIRGQEDLFKVLESLHEISGKADSSMIENKCSNPVNSQDSKDPDSWETPRSTNSDHTTVISGPRLSNIYVDQETDLMDKVRERRERDNEERRKLDLKTQIERMRQKEMLRKRVLERQQIAKSTANNLSTTGSTNSIPITSNYRPPSIRAGLGAGAGYSSCDGIGFTNMASPQKTETHEHVDLISSKKTGSFLSQRKMQEPFKGLGDYAKNHPLAGTEVGKAPSNSVIAASKDLASRGLGLTNMVKKK